MLKESVTMLTRKCAILFILGPFMRSALVVASESCLYCRGINCQRSSYQATEQCADKLSACVSVFQKGVVEAQGCLEQLEGSWRAQCESEHSSRVQCEICVTDKCNNVSSSELSCLQCSDTEDARCRNAPEQLMPETCAIARTGRSLCYASIKEQRIERGCSLTMSEQRICLADVNCQLCDPLEMPHCNDQLLEDALVPTEPPVSSTSSSTSSSSSSSTPTSSSSSSSTTTPSPTTQSTLPPTKPPTMPPTATPKPNSAHKIWVKNIPFLLVLSHLLLFVIWPQ